MDNILDSNIFTPKLLSKEDKASLDFVKARINDLQETRKEVYGTDLDSIWQEADNAYIPHRLKTKGKKVIATDEDRGWRGSLVNLGSSNWQADIANANPFVKIQIALSILVDRNPKGVFTAMSKQFESTNLLMKQLYQRSWEVAKSKQQLKLFILNLCKYGWACGRTYPYKLTRNVKKVIEFNDDNPSDSKYEDTEVEVYNDIMRENLDPNNVWIDDMAKPNNPLSIRDWTWREVYSRDSFDEEFKKYKLWKYVKEGGATTETVGGSKPKEYKEKKLIEVKFYENVLKDLFMVIANGVPIIIEPLPISDASGLKKLSLWQGYWTLRHSNCPYGIGLYEAMRYENSMLDRIRNMTMDQLTMCIYKSWFYQGTQALTETGQITLEPGVGKQVLDPKNIKFIDIPAPGVEAWKGLEVLQKAVDDASGITPPLGGEITGKTAFEVAQAKEAALGRLKFPLDNICDALEQEGYISISLIQLLYSIPEVIKISDPDLINQYIKETGADPSLYERVLNKETQQLDFNAKVYPEFPLNLEEDQGGNLVETEKTQFFRIKPKFLKWEGIINIEPQSILTPSKQIDKALDLEMYNMLIPLIAQPPELYKKVAENIVKLYDKDPKDVLPESWLVKPQEQPMFIPQQQGMAGGENPNQGAEKMVGSTQMPANPQGMVQQMMSKLTQPTRKV